MLVFEWDSDNKEGDPISADPLEVKVCTLVAMSGIRDASVVEMVQIVLLSST